MHPPPGRQHAPLDWAATREPAASDNRTARQEYSRIVKEEFLLVLIVLSPSRVTRLESPFQEECCALKAPKTPTTAVAALSGLRMDRPVLALPESISQ
jgi:hypothetical protein